MKNVESAQSGDTRRALECLRDTLAEQIDTTEANVHAQLAAQYRATLLAIEELGKPEGQKGGVDELKQRRAAKDRRSTTDASANA